MKQVHTRNIIEVVGYIMMCTAIFLLVFGQKPQWPIPQTPNEITLFWKLYEVNHTRPRIYPDTTVGYFNGRLYQCFLTLP